MMGEWRGKARGTQCSAEAGKAQHHTLQVKWGGGITKLSPGVNGFIRPPVREHGESFQPALMRAGIRVWAGRRAQGWTCSPALAQLHSLPAALGQDLCCCAAELPVRASHGWGILMMADNCRRQQWF